VNHGLYRDKIFAAVAEIMNLSKLLPTLYRHLETVKYIYVISASRYT